MALYVGTYDFDDVDGFNEGFSTKAYSSSLLVLNLQREVFPD